jgi:quercetin dioxygenase-like cupin family protein
MDATIYRLDELQQDGPVPLLRRRQIFGERILFAQVRLEKGCHVDLHAHENEQIAYVVSGKVKWYLGEPGTPERREFVAEGGTVIHLPSGFPHGVDALEETLIIDLLSPPGPMGVDRIGAQAQ